MVRAAIRDGVQRHVPGASCRNHAVPRRVDRRAWQKPAARASVPSAPTASLPQPRSISRREIHRLRGEFAKAEEGIAPRACWDSEPQPGLALLRMAQGRTDVACAAIRRLMSATTDRLQRARLLPAHLEIMLAMGDLEEARSTCPSSRRSRSYSTPTCCEPWRPRRKARPISPQAMPGRRSVHLRARSTRGNGSRRRTSQPACGRSSAWPVARSATTRRARSNSTRPELRSSSWAPCRTSFVSRPLTNEQRRARSTRCRPVNSMCFASSRRQHQQGHCGGVAPERANHRPPRRAISSASSMSHRAPPPRPTPTTASSSDHFRRGGNYPHRGRADWVVSPKRAPGPFAPLSYGMTPQCEGDNALR